MFMYDREAHDTRQKQRVSQRRKAKQQQRRTDRERAKAISAYRRAVAAAFADEQCPN